MIRLDKDFIFIFVLFFQKILFTSIRCACARPDQILPFGDYLLHRETIFLSLLKLATVIAVVALFYRELKADLAGMLSGCRDRPLTSLAVLAWSFFYPFYLAFPLRTTHITVAVLMLKHSIPMFLEKMLLDTFLDTFLFIHLMFVRITEGKRLERMMARRDQRLIFHVVLISTALALLVAAQRYYRDFDSVLTFVIFFFMEFALFMLFDFVRSFLFCWLLAVIGKALAVLFFCPVYEI